MQKEEAVKLMCKQVRLRVHVVGINTFIGAHVARYLAKQGQHVTGTISRPLSEFGGLQRKRLDWAAAGGVRILELAMSDEEQTRRFITEERPDVWIHHTGLAGHYESVEYDLDTGYRENVLPLRVIYEALKRSGCSGIVLTGSGEEYSSLPSLSFEEDTCWPLTPYGLSKLTETVRAFQLSQQYELPTRVARLFTPYGPLDEEKKLLPAAIRALREGEPLALSPCLQKRDFLHVEDIVLGYEKLIEDLKVREAWFDIFNLCGGEGVTVRRLLLDMARLMDADPALLQFDRLPAREGETAFRAGSNDKAKGLLHWKPRSLSEGLTRYVSEMTHDTPAY